MENKRILLADDESEIRKLIIEMIKGNDGDGGLAEAYEFEFIEFDNGEATLKAFREQRHFDLVISDIEMGGGMNGLLLARNIFEIVPKQQLIILSGKPKLLEEATLSNIPNIRKPFHMRDFIDMIKKALAA